jgi:MoxR-like ATPase
VPDDIKDLVKPVVAHRLLTKGLAQDGSYGAEAILEKILRTVPAPR